MTKKFEIMNEWVRKIFRINSSSSNRRVSKMTIHNETPISSSPKNSGKLKNITETRPKACPYCRTNESANIYRTEGQIWKCKKCEYEWN